MYLYWYLYFRHDYYQLNSFLVILLKWDSNSWCDKNCGKLIYTVKLPSYQFFKWMFWRIIELHEEMLNVLWSAGFSWMGFYLWNSFECYDPLKMVAPGLPTGQKKDTHMHTQAHIHKKPFIQSASFKKTSGCNFKSHGDDHWYLLMSAVETCTSKANYRVQLKVNSCGRHTGKHWILKVRLWGVTFFPHQTNLSLRSYWCDFFLSN